MSENYQLRDPTGEAAAASRQPITPPKSLEGLTVALLDIGKERSDEFLDQIEKRFTERGLAVKRYAKGDNSKTAPEKTLQSITTETDVVVEALAD